MIRALPWPPPYMYTYSNFINTYPSNSFQPVHSPIKSSFEGQCFNIKLKC